MILEALELFTRKKTSSERHVHASTCLACRVAFIVMPRIAWVRRQRAGANPGGPPLLDLWLRCWSLASGVVRCFIGSIEVFFLVKSSRALWSIKPGFQRCKPIGAVLF